MPVVGCAICDALFCDGCSALRAQVVVRHRLGRASWSRPVNDGGDGDDEYQGKGSTWWDYLPCLDTLFAQEESRALCDDCGYSALKSVASSKPPAQKMCAVRTPPPSLNSCVQERVKRISRQRRLGKIKLMVYSMVSLLAAIVYLNTLEGGFVLDDRLSVVENVQLRPDMPMTELLWRDAWGTPLKSNISHKSYRPLFVLSLRANFALGGLEPWSYHAVNILLHVIASVLVVYVVQECIMASPPGISDNSSSADLNLGIFKRQWVAGFSVGVLFAVHPIHTEAVANVNNRNEMLAAIFAMLAYAVYVRGAGPRNRRSQSDRPRDNFISCGRPWLVQVWTVFFALLATLCKETGVTVIGICLIHDCLDMLVTQRCAINAWHAIAQSKKVNGGSDAKIMPGVRSSQKVKRLCASTSPLHATNDVSWLTFPRAALACITRNMVLIAMSVVLMYVRLRMQGGLPTIFDMTRMNPAALEPTILARGMSFSLYAARHAWLLAVPWNLCAEYGGPDSIPIVSSVFDPRNLFTIFMAVCVLAIAMLGMRPWCGCCVKRWRRLSKSDNDALFGRECMLAVAWVLIPFVPASNMFFPVGFVVAERVLYMPSIGFCTLAVFAVIGLWRRWPRTTAALFFSLVCVCASITVARNRDWNDPVRLWESNIRVTPKNAFPYYNLGLALRDRHRQALAAEGRDSALARALQDKSRGAFLDCLSREPCFPEAHSTLGNVLLDDGDRESAIREYRYEIECNPNYGRVYHNLGVALWQGGELHEGLASFRTGYHMLSKVNDPFLPQLKQYMDLLAVEVSKLEQARAVHGDDVTIIVDKENGLPPPLCSCPIL